MHKLTVVFLPVSFVQGVSFVYGLFKKKTIETNDVHCSHIFPPYNTQSTHTGLVKQVELRSSSRWITCIQSEMKFVKFSKKKCVIPIA